MKKLSCWVGRHAWTNRIEHGDEYSVCSKCGRIVDGPGGQIDESGVTWAKFSDPGRFRAPRR
jgi:hypothetical protein